MPDDINSIWIDSTFSEPGEGSEDVTHQVQFTEADTIGAYSMPVIYRAGEAITLEKNIQVEFFQEINTISGINNLAHEYFVYEPPVNSGVGIHIVEFFTKPTVSGYKNIDMLYSTGYYTVSGVVSKKVVFTAGNEYPDYDNVPIAFYTLASVSGVADRIVNYTNFSGNLTPSGVPIPYNNGTYICLTEYFDAYTATSGIVDRIVDITFAGWVDFPITADVYSADQTIKEGYTTEVNTISGSIQVNYCALENYATINFESAVISGTIGYLENDIYSAEVSQGVLTLDIDLFSLKITNFSLGIGEYTTASGLISVDIEDDVCAVSTSGTYFLLDGVQVPVTFSGITDGYRMFYDGNFDSLEGPTTFTVHAENECGDILEQDIYLTFGYIVEYNNERGSLNNIDYGFGNKVVVRVTAENYASCPKLSGLAWEFESKEQFNSDLRASITGYEEYSGREDLSASIYPQSTAYYYEKEFTVVVNAKDFAGNEMTPLILRYRIEDKP